MDRRSFLLAGLGALAWPTQAQAQPRVDVGIRYVATDGDDANDGLTWGTSKATIAAAVADLPTNGSGDELRHTGVVEIGAGLFTETDLPLEFNADILYRGRKTVGHPALKGGTVIQAGADNNLFAPTPGFAGVFNAHHAGVENLLMDGGQVTGDFDLLQVSRGGFNCWVRNCFFRQAARRGIFLNGSAINVHIEDCTWGGTRGDADIYFYNNGAIPNLLIEHSQADEGAGAFLFVEHADTNPAQGHQIEVRGLKVESATAGDYDKVIHSKPRTISGGNPIRYLISNVSAAQNGGGGTAVVYEESQLGAASDFVLMNINGQGYAKAFQSDKTAKASAGSNVVLGCTEALEVFV